jgi:hypothetical protein
MAVRGCNSGAACGVVTAPILLTCFGYVPVYFVASSALAVPFVAPLLGLALGFRRARPCFALGCRVACLSNRERVRAATQSDRPAPAESREA